jgi:hypothetical protein
VKLERHVGGLSVFRKRNYLLARGWRVSHEGWTCARHTEEPQRLSRALHFQLTEDLTAGLARSGWRVEGYSPRGYARLTDPEGKGSCSLPAALRRQARREKRKVAEFTYLLYLAAATGLDAEPGP